MKASETLEMIPCISAINSAKEIIETVGNLLRNSDEKFVFQAVHMILNFGSSQELGMNHKKWQPGEKRINKFCFIGKNLDKKKMISQLC